MICRLCLAKAATHHMTERSPSGRFEEAHYCPEFCEAKYLKPPPPGSIFPRPRLTLKNIMILVGVWAIPNAVAAWVLRGGHVTGTPAQLRQWTIHAFLGVNCFLGFCGALMALGRWLNRVSWYKRTGGLLPMPEPKKLTIKQQASLIVWMIPLFAWAYVATVLDAWLTPKIWPIQRRSPQLFALFAWAPLVPLLILVLSKDRALRERLRQEWEAASRPERVFRVMTVAWGVGFLLAIVMGGQGLLRWGFVPWFPIPPVMLIGIVVLVALKAALAASIRRR